MIEKRRPINSSRQMRSRELKEVEGTHGGTNSLFLRNDSSAFITRYIEPELLRAYGVGVLRDVPVIDIERSMSIPNDGTEHMTDYGLNIQKKSSDTVPLTVEVSVTERQTLSDAQVLVQWPIIKSHEVLGSEMQQVATMNALGSELGLEEFDATDDQAVVGLLQRQVDMLKSDENETMTTTLFGDCLVAFVRRSLTLRHQERPVLSLTTGLIYGESEYRTHYSAGNSPWDKVIGNTLDETALFQSVKDRLGREVDHAEGAAFIEALARLGFRG